MPKIKPLHDKVLVERIESQEKTAGGIVLPDSAKEKPTEGRVVAVGSGKVSDKGERIPLGVKPGDFVAYYAKAQDNDTVQGPKIVTSDIYFIRVRSLDRSVREAQTQAGGRGGGGGGGGANQASGLAQQQKEIISATHNVERDRPTIASTSNSVWRPTSIPTRGMPGSVATAGSPAASNGWP